MKFFAQLKETDESLKMKEMGVFPHGEDRFRSFKPLRFNDIQLSIQANYVTYSVPSKTVSLDQYESMEVRIAKNGSLVTVNEIINSGDLKTKCSEYFSEDDFIYYYLPVSLIEDIYNELNKGEMIYEKSGNGPNQRAV